MLSIAIHGGAGRASGNAGHDAACRDALGTALDAGYAVLERGGASIDAVTVAVTALEDDALFNAGVGSVLTRDGAAELDAAVMDGRTLRAGAVAGVRHVRNPVGLARRVMENSSHVLLVGNGAEEFALEQGIVLVANAALRTAARERELRELLATSRAEHGAPAEGGSFGTVGAVACDAQGNVAAATSTGGTAGKRAGRVGDTPIIGAGTYANNASAAVSATGHGEHFIRAAIAHDICARIEYLGMSLIEAIREVVHKRLTAMRAGGGVIAVNAAGELALEFNTECMFRAWRTSHGLRGVGVSREP